MRAKMYNQFLCSSLMLPEHREALTRYYVEEQQKEAECMPEVDEQELAVWDQLIRISMAEGCIVAVTYMISGEIKSLSGVAVGTRRSELLIKDDTPQKVKAVPLKGIIVVREA